jgi:hypothetical protein
MHADVSNLTQSNVCLRPLVGADATFTPMKVTRFGTPADARATDQANEVEWRNGLTVGSLFEVLIAHQDLVPGTGEDAESHPLLLGVTDELVPRFVFQDLALGFRENRTFFMLFNDYITADDHFQPPTMYYFNTDEAESSFFNDHVNGNGLKMRTMVPVHHSSGAEVGRAQAVAVLARCKGPQKSSCLLIHLGNDYQQHVLDDPFQALFDESNLLGPVFQSQKRISQHLCAPILNPNARIGCTSPLNYETMHLPPELRDFKLELRDVNFSFLPGASMLENLVLYEFNGGNQTVAAEQSLLHLPQFREHKSTNVATDGTFDFEMFSPYGMPSHVAVFARDLDMSKDYLVQPLIKQLSIQCNTTMKKSNTVLNANVHQLYHITQRNVNNRARYNRHTFNKRQVVLLSAEDIGLMGLHMKEYQNEKRALFRFSGAVDQVARLHAILIYNNRGLHVYGKQLRVTRLKD